MTSPFVFSGTNPQSPIAGDASVPAADRARIQANVAKMRAQGATEDEVLQYLQYEDGPAAPGIGEPRTGPRGDRISRNIASMRAQGATEQDIETYLRQYEGLKPEADTNVNARNLLRAAGQAATFGFSDELGLADRDAEKAFASAHPIADFAAKIGGGSLLPLAATIGIPALASLAGVVGTSAVVGGLSGAGEAEGNLADRAKAAAVGAPVGAAGGLLGYGASKVLGKTGGAIARWLMPNRAASRAVGQVGNELIDNPAAVQATMDAANQLAPGSASIATSDVPKQLGQSRFRFMADALGKSPEAAAKGEALFTQQMAAAKGGLDLLGQQMDKLVTGRDVPVTPKLRDAISKAADVLGGKAPDVPAAGPLQVAAPAGFQPTALTAPAPTAKTVPLADLRDALSRLRFMRRQVLMRDSDRINGAALHELSAAEAVLKKEVYAVDPQFAALDKPYAQLARHRDEAENLLTATQRSRSRFATNRAHGAEEASTGGSIHTTAGGNALAILRALAPGNGKAVADATANMLLRPGANVADLLAAAPKPNRFLPAARTGVIAPLPAGIRGLLFPPQEQP